jgi:hypothetical protein
MRRLRNVEKRQLTDHHFHLTDWYICIAMLFTAAASITNTILKYPKAYDRDTTKAYRTA